MFSLGNRWCQPKVAGCYVPRFLVRMLAALYPQVRLVWNYHVKRWAVIEITRKGASHTFFVCGPVNPARGTVGDYRTPNVENTIGVLRGRDAMRLLRTAYERDRFLDDLEQIRKTPAELDAERRIDEGSRMLQAAMRNKMSVVPRPRRRGR